MGYVFWILGLFIDQTVSYISPEIEAKIFSFVSLPRPELVGGDDLRQAELQRMVDALQECANVVYLLRVHLSDSEEANAMALPGGGLFVFNGLLDKVMSENDLSIVLAHESAHFLNRNHLRGMGMGIVFTALAALIVGSNFDFTMVVMV